MYISDLTIESANVSPSVGRTPTQQLEAKRSRDFKFSRINKRQRVQSISTSTPTSPSTAISLGMFYK